MHIGGTTSNPSYNHPTYGTAPYSNNRPYSGCTTPLRNDYETLDWHARPTKSQSSNSSPSSLSTYYEYREHVQPIYKALLLREYDRIRNCSVCKEESKQKPCLSSCRRTRICRLAIGGRMTLGAAWGCPISSASLRHNMSTRIHASLIRDGWHENRRLSCKPKQCS